MTSKTNKIRAALEAALSDDQPYIDRCKEALSELDGCVLIPADLLDPGKVWGMFVNDESADDWDSFQVQLFAPYVNGEKK